MPVTAKLTVTGEPVVDGLGVSAVMTTLLAALAAKVDWLADAAV